MNTNRDLKYSMSNNNDDDDEYHLERQILRIFERVFQPRVPIEWTASLRCYNISWEELKTFIETLNMEFGIRLTHSFADKCLSVGSLVQTICAAITNKSANSSCESFVSFTVNGVEHSDSSSTPSHLLVNGVDTNEDCITEKQSIKKPISNKFPLTGRIIQFPDKANVFTFFF